MELSTVFNSTIDEAVDAIFRLTELSGYVRKYKWFGLAITPVFVILLFLIFNQSFLRYVSGGILLVTWVPFFLLSYRKLMKREMRKRLIRMFGTDQPVSCQYSLITQGIIFMQLGQEIRFNWGNVRKFSCSESVLELIMEPVAVALIPRRIFSGSEEAQKWIDYIEDHAHSLVK
ncbi:MAG: hypothetical protein KAH31_09010 [Candidatus Sabulitectum sp.]|nr:hypothetical protein [Candidatus Sabulitectum sp.]